MQNPNHKEEILIIPSCQAKTAGHKIVQILNMPKISLQVMHDSVKQILFLWIKAAVSGLQGQSKSMLEGAVGSHTPRIFSNNTVNVMFSAFQEYASQIKSQVMEDFCCMKEYVERQERNTLMFIEQEQKAAEQKIEETIHHLCVEVDRLLDINAQTVSDEVAEYE